MREVGDFLVDDAFITAVFEGKDIDSLKKTFQVEECELKQLDEAIGILLVPSDVPCGLSKEEKQRIKNNSLITLVKIKW